MPRAGLKRRAAPPPRPRAKRSTAAPVDADGRERVLIAAVRSFSEIGYEGTTTAAVAREAGVTQPLVHHHFGSKDGLWRAAMDKVFANIERDVAVPDFSRPLPEALLGAVDEIIHFVADHPEATRIVAREGAAPSPRLTYLVDRYLRVPFERVAGAVRAGQRAGLVRNDIDPRLVVFAILGAASHMFDVTALARESLGIDTSSAKTRAEFVAAIRVLLSSGLFSARR